MPLFLPSIGVLDLSYSERIGGGAKTFGDGDPDELSSAVAGGFRDLPSEEAELRRIVVLAARSPNVRLLEAAVYSHVLRGHDARALSVIKRAIQVETVYPYSV